MFAYYVRMLIFMRAFLQTMLIPNDNSSIVIAILNIETFKIFPFPIKKRVCCIFIYCTWKF